MIVVAQTGPEIGIEQPVLLGLRVVITRLVPWYAWKWSRQQKQAGIG